MSDDTPTIPFVRTNVLNDEERDIATYLRQQHLPGVDADDEAAVALEIEQARLLLIGAAGTIVFAVTQMLTLSRAICAVPLFIALPLLLFAMVGSWFALLGGAKLRAHRVDRRYKIYDAERSYYLKTKRSHDDPDLNVLNGVWNSIIEPEIAVRNKLAKHRSLNVWIAAAGVICALWSAIGTTEHRACLFELQSTGDNSAITKPVRTDMGHPKPGIGEVR